MPATPTSPRVEALREALANGQPDVLAAFWAEMQARHTPLFESAADDETQVLATFLWRGDSDTRHVLLFCSIIAFSPDSSHNKMQLLEGSDVWFMTLPVRRDLRATYHFSPNDPLKPALAYVSAADYTAWAATYWQTDPLNSTDGYLFPADDETPGDQPVTVSVICGPDAAPQPYVAERPDVSKGTVALQYLVILNMRDEDDVISSAKG